MNDSAFAIVMFAIIGGALRVSTPFMFVALGECLTFSSRSGASAAQREETERAGRCRHMDFAESGRPDPASTTGDGDWFEESSAIVERFLDNIGLAVLGKREEVRLVLAALMCGGHVLLEDVPGTAKTVLARAIAQSMEGAVSSRIQCTPDLQPTDVTGLAVFNQKDRDFEFRPGPVFANVVLVDEINRAIPKTQSALLEAMAEQQVTADGETRPLPDPFLLLATENPIEYEGTFPLPEAQLDRFFVKTALGYPTADEELRIVDEQLDRHPLGALAPVVTVSDVERLRRSIHRVFELVEWNYPLMAITRSPARATIAESSALRMVI